MLRSELHGYVPSTRNKNFDFVDRATRKWLARRKEDVLISRVWLKTECLRLLHEAARVCTIDEFLREGAVFKCWFEIFSWQSFYSGIVCRQQVDFLLQGLGANKAGTFRILVKPHKDPVVGRPILNLGKSWLASAAAFLVETLKPAASSLSYVVQSSVEILDVLSGQRVTESTSLATFDISNLYPSVDRTHFMTCLARRTRTFWGAKASFASFLITLVEFVLGFQFINNSDKFWRVDTGLPTGLSASVIFAKLYLADLNDFILNECGCVLTWRRYIDDAFALPPFPVWKRCQVCAAAIEQVAPCLVGMFLFQESGLCF